MRNHKAALDRRNWVIGQMAENGYITRRAGKRRDRRAARHPDPRRSARRPQDADYFVEEVRRLLYAQYGEQALYDGGLQVRSTLDTRLQNYAVNALRSRARALRPPPWLARRAQQYRRRRQLEGHAGGGRRTSRASTPGASPWCSASTADRSAQIGLADGSDGDDPVQRAHLGAAQSKMPAPVVGPAPPSPQDVFKVGDVIYVEPLDDKGDYGLRQVPRDQRRHRRDGSAHRPRARAVGRLLLRVQPVRPRHAGDAPARLVVQAVRLCRGARQWLHAGQQGARCAVRR